MAEQAGVEARVRELVEASARATGCELWDMHLAGSPGSRSLKVYVDAPGGVDMDRLTLLSRTLVPALEEQGLDDIDLEVSSPGAERRLRNLDDYRRFLGERVNLRVRQDGSETVVEGALSEVSEGAVTVTGDSDQVTTVPLERLVEGRLAVAFGGGDRIRRRKT